MWDWIIILIKGIGFGIVLAFLIGPAFFSLIQTSIRNGFTSGVFMAMGISFSDIFYIFISYLGITQLAESSFFKTWFGILGGVVMLAFGAFSLMKRAELMLPARERSEINRLGKKGLLGSFLKGALMNGLNPFLFVFWVGVVGAVANENHHSNSQTLLFFVGTMVTAFSLDLTKAYLSGKLMSIITPRFMSIVNKVVGSALVLFSFRMFYGAYEAGLHFFQ
ncbi:LysE family translocator [Aureibacter tunicatorum]|uniref:Threonine/homoserine/homoserine lactone efflux protein n=1 Tax=Aureibacter tunicatorum TaxID=866807 RepID=A0AAE3XR38_9BACT|nr:LysE family transporter [Aureibacter tunicatorum]MDR6241218.1 threonine/homoserine/homoserine lactone efflux protein [Aureibacter tunicatorum]BDD03479.1 lysine transporter LysE [Aureibacter tunicatorum]